jgi:acylphosphatase
MKTARLKISGLVQGVYFRKFVKDKADNLELKGHVRNLDTGEVEVLIEGKDENILSMISLCREGAPHSKVKDVDVQELNHIGFDDFKILDI